MIKTMKKNYVKPEAMNVEMELSPVMTSVSGETGNAGVGDGNTGNNTPDLSGKNRGEWGNMWK